MLSLRTVKKTTEFYRASSSSSSAGDASAGEKVVSVTVRISAGGGNNASFRTTPFHVKQQLGGVVSCAPQWHDDHHGLRIDRSVTNLRCKIIARVEKSSSSSSDTTAVVTDREMAAATAAVATPAGVVMAAEAGVTSTEIVLASASLDLDAARDGYNFVQLFSAGRSNDGACILISEEEESKTRIKREGRREEPRPMGQLVLKLEWGEVGQEGAEKEEVRGHAMLVVHGASGLAKPDS